MTYSKDYRKMILDKHEAGKSIRSLAHEFNISTRTIQNWKKQPARKVVTGQSHYISILKNEISTSK